MADRPGVTIFWVPVAAVLLAFMYPLGLGFRQAPAPSTSNSHITPKHKRQASTGQTSGTRNNQAAKNSAPKHDVRKLLSEFYGIPDYQNIENQPESQRAYRLNCVIATVPDPFASHLPHLFDRFVGSIQRAAESSDFVMDRYDLPWLEELQEKQEKKDEVQDNPTQSSTTASEPHNYEKDPGLILFRDSAGKRLLIVFLVGETPTSGIHKPAFLSALRQIDSLKINSQKIKILGPSFSGSAESMEGALKNWLAETHRQNQLPSRIPPEIQIVSGSATAISISCENVRPPCRSYFDLGGAAATVTFAATVIPDAMALDRLYAELARKNKYSESHAIRIGVLAEANTAYGSSISQGVASQSAGPDTGQNGGQQNSNNTTSEQDQKDKPTDLAPSVIALPFPLHISRLRSETAKLRSQKTDNAQQATQSQDASKYLPVPFDDETQDATDSIPPFSELETSSAELILSNLLTTLSREHFDYVGIAASDVRDTIFLAREVREHSPSSVLFSLNADLLYVHPEVNPNMRGMLIVTPYPLFTLNQRWMWPNSRGRRLQFPDQNSQGVYNAMLVLLCKQKMMLEYGVPFWRDSVSSRTSEPNSPPIPVEFRQPPLWITTVGRDGFWPVGFLFDRQQDTPSEKQNSSAYVHVKSVARPDSAGPTGPDNSGSIPIADDWLLGTIPHSAIFVLCCWSIVCAVPAIVFLFFDRPVLAVDDPQQSPQAGSAESKRPLRENQRGRVRVYLDCIFPQNRGECRAYFLVGGIAALSALIVAVAAFAITSLRGIRQMEYWAALMAMTAAVCFTLAACLRLTREVWKMMTGPGSSRIARMWLGIPVLFSSALVFGFAVRLAADWLSSRFNLDAFNRLAATGIVTGYRALNLSSGVSPLVPLFLIASATCFWALGSVRRICLTESLPSNSRSECGGQSDQLEGSEREKTEEGGKVVNHKTDAFALFNSATPSFVAFHTLEGRIQDLVRCPSLRISKDQQLVPALVAVLIIAAGVYLFWGRLVVSLETPVFYLLFGAAFVIVYLAIAFNLLRLLYLWLGLAAILSALERRPFRAAFSRFHKSFPDLPRINLASAPPPLTAFHFSLEQAAHLACCSEPPFPEDCQLAESINATKRQIGSARSEYETATSADAGSHPCRSQLAFLKAQRLLAQASDQIEDALDLHWKTCPKPELKHPSQKSTCQNVAEKAEEFLVGRTVLFFAHVFPQLKNMAFSSLVSLLLLLAAVSSYPFQPHKPIVMFSWIIIFSFAGVALYMSIAMNRSPLLSNLNGAKPGQLNWDRDLIMRILVYAVLPIFGFLGVQSPDIISQVLTLFSPGAAGH